MNLQETIIQPQRVEAQRYVILLRGHDQPSCTEPPIPGSRHLQDGGCRGAGQTRSKDRHVSKKISKLRYTALLEDVICGTDRNFTKDDLAAIADCAFIRRHENLLIQGKCGCGKSFLACALGRQACMLGYRTLYLNMNSFVEKVALSKLDGSYLRMITNLEKYDLLIWDDFGLQPMDDKTRLAMLQILEERYERKVRHYRLTASHCQMV